jgi:hypothetical protein
MTLFETTDTHHVNAQTLAQLSRKWGAQKSVVFLHRQTVATTATKKAATTRAEGFNHESCAVHPRINGWRVFTRL